MHSPRATGTAGPCGGRKHTGNLSDDVDQLQPDLQRKGEHHDEITHRGPTIDCLGGHKGEDADEHPAEEQPADTRNGERAVPRTPPCFL
jgi:hypothetical protein